MVIIYNTLINYEFKNIYIKDEFENKKEYYYLGFQSVEYYITKVVYNYLLKYNTNIEFCCDFTLLQKIIKRFNSKEYFKKIFISIEEKYIYSFIGAVIVDNYIEIESVINKLYKIENYLLTIYKKEENKYLFVNKFLENNNYKIETLFDFKEEVNCTCCIVELNHYFTNSSTTMLEAKYIVLEEIAEYLIENKLYYEIEEVVLDFDINNACEKLELLYEKKYINKPNYFYIIHDQYQTVKHEVRCSIDGVSFYAVKINNEKEIAKNQAALAMIEMLIIQNNT